MSQILTANQIVENSRCTEENGIITFTLPATDGTTGGQWIVRIENKGNRVGAYAKQLLLSSDFKPTTGVIYSVKVLKGELFSEGESIIENIWDKTKEMKLGQLNAEAACLIRENFTDEELEAMDLNWIVVMHEPIKDSICTRGLLCVQRSRGGRWLHSYFDSPDGWWGSGRGFAFSAT